MMCYFHHHSITRSGSSDSNCCFWKLSHCVSNDTEKLSFKVNLSIVPKFTALRRVKIKFGDCISASICGNSLYFMFSSDCSFLSIWWRRIVVRHGWVRFTPFITLAQWEEHVAAAQHHNHSTNVEDDQDIQLQSALKGDTGKLCS